MVGGGTSFYGPADLDTDDAIVGMAGVPRDLGGVIEIRDHAAARAAGLRRLATAMRPE
jgi:hypothetical protein